MRSESGKRRLQLRRRIAVDPGEPCRLQLHRYWTYSWNDANQLTVAADYQSNGVLIQSVTFRYDVFGNRVEEDDYNASTQVTTVTKFAYDAAGNIWADLNSSNQLVDRRLFVDVNGQTQPFVRIDSSGYVSWYLTDHLGSVRLITDNSAAVIDQIDYDAWGNITNETYATTNGDRYKYASGQYDAILGMTLYAQNSTGRWYMASNGNWLNADPTGLAAGPNPYDYVGNNPTNAFFLPSTPGLPFCNSWISQNYSIQAKKYASKHGVWGSIKMVTTLFFWEDVIGLPPRKK